MRRLPVVLLTVVLLGVGACSEGGWTPDEMAGRVVFSGVSDHGLLNIHLYDFANQETVNITNSGMHENAPALSPDGTQIVFHAVPDADLENGNWDIYTVGVDGSGILRVTDNPSLDLFPDWSPDGTQIVFERVRASDDGRDIYTVNADGTDEQRLTDRPGEDVSPSWSPDGTQIAFATDRDGVPAACAGFGSEDCNSEIYLMDANGGNLRRVTDSQHVVDGFPDWSPDGTRLVFHSNQADPPWGFDIYTINMDGTDLTQITFDPEDLPDGTFYSESNPSWSPDGEWIIFHSDRTIYSEDHEIEMLDGQLFISDTDGGQTDILETGIVDSNWADWKN